MYEIKITKTEAVRKIQPKRWLKVGQVEKKRPVEHFRNGGAETYISDEMGYTPEVETLEEETTEIYKQSVADLNLAVVIKAINGLE